MQLLSDTGLMGFIPYMLLLFGSIWWLGRSARQTKRLHPGLEVYPRGIQVSLAACSLGTFFLSRVDFDLTYMILMCGAAWWSLTRTNFGGLDAAAPQTVALAQQGFEPQQWRPAVPAGR
jgi:hypothetical protein